MANNIAPVKTSVVTVTRHTAPFLIDHTKDTITFLAWNKEVVTYENCYNVVPEPAV